MIKKIFSKTFLKENEIYFTTLATVFLSMMAIILSINSYYQTKRQVTIDLADKLPNFNVYSETRIDSTTGDILNTDIIIEKIDGIAKNMNAEIVSILETSVDTIIDVFINGTKINKTEYENSKYENKIFHRYNEFSQYDKHNDRIVISHSDDSFENQAKTCYNLMIKRFERNRLKLNYKRYELIKVNYVNFLNEETTNYYLIESNFKKNYNTRKLKIVQESKNYSKTETEKVFRKVEKEKYNIVSPCIGSITAFEILDYNIRIERF
ncbi:hypothetical protein [Psychroserpens algicola]|uniref:Uncharacterized protein n=1 Tax=Psychroserpens algicola TaxID=1719034 RepID=A0ABT0HAZ4_9FLAO|nr:hypothetical protein [Psychroserpens algicola]MCK8481543.1 hypothetical protein [Psychroserpens algicola]